MKVYSVAFKINGKGYHFKSEKDYDVNDYVIVETEKGLQYGKIIKILDDGVDYSNFKDIVRKATKKDTDEYYKILKDNEKAYKKCKEIVSDMDLNMSIISADFAFDKSQLVFNFISSERVDFRELAKKLASIYHTRIELRQVGARDKAKEISGIGVCGQKLCCSKFLNEIDAITMNMAKDQNLALNPSKINGLCGRLLCCLQYEDEEYVRCGKGMPSVGETIKTDNGDGTVISVDILNRKCKVLVGSNKEEISFDDK